MDDQEEKMRNGENVPTQEVHQREREAQPYYIRATEVMRLIWVNEGLVRLFKGPRE
jgi:hypothetical protein